MSLIAFLTLLPLATLPLPALAWNISGHMLSGIIAYQEGLGGLKVRSCYPTLLGLSLYFLEFSAHRRVVDSQVRSAGSCQTVKEPVRAQELRHRN